MTASASSFLCHTLITPFSVHVATLTDAEREALVKIPHLRVNGLSGAIAFAATWTLHPASPTETLTPTAPHPAYCTAPAPSSENGTGHQRQQSST